MREADNNAWSISYFFYLRVPKEYCNCLMLLYNIKFRLLTNNGSNNNDRNSRNHCDSTYIAHLFSWYINEFILVSSRDLEYKQTNNLYALIFHHSKIVHHYYRHTFGTGFLRLYSITKNVVPNMSVTIVDTVIESVANIFSWLETR